MLLPVPLSILRGFRWKMLELVGGWVMTRWPLLPWLESREVVHLKFTKTLGELFTQHRNKETEEHRNSYTK